MTDLEKEVRNILKNSLHINAAYLQEDNPPLLDHVPELDSISVLNLLIKLEEAFDITIEDSEIRAEDFQDLAAIVSLVQRHR